MLPAALRILPVDVPAWARRRPRRGPGGPAQAIRLGPHGAGTLGSARSCRDRPCPVHRGAVDDFRQAAHENPGPHRLGQRRLEQLVVGVIGDHGGPHQTERQNSSQCTENSPLGQSSERRSPHAGPEPAGAGADWQGSLAPWSVWHRPRRPDRSPRTPLEAALMRIGSASRPSSSMMSSSPSVNVSRLSLVDLQERISPTIISTSSESMRATLRLRIRCPRGSRPGRSFIETRFICLEGRETVTLGR